MKLNIKQFAFLSILVITVIFVGCEKNDSDEEFGYSNIYIPQALTSGGTNLNYLVPAGLDSATYNFQIDKKNNKLNVLLGVTRSGKQSLDSYSVKVSTNSDTITQLIGSGGLKVDPDNTKAVVLLPAEAYTLPQTVSVPAGQYGESFYLSVDINQLKTYAGKKVALAVILTNPSMYTLNTAKNKVVIIINVDALHLP